MTAKDLTTLLKQKAKNRDDVICDVFDLQYSEESQYEFLRIASREIKEGDKIILVRAGIHGEEKCGVLTVLDYFDEIIEYIHSHGLKLIIYPLGNPLGFDSDARYCFENDIENQEAADKFVGNNDFVRYELDDGAIVDDILDQNHFTNWYWSSDEKLGLNLPKETKLQHELLKKDPLNQIVAVLDLHQDYITPNVGPCAYHYAFGDLSVYAPIVKNIEALMPVVENKGISAGFVSDVPLKSDGNGFIVRHDGTLTDLFWRLGVKHSITVETTGATPTDVACKINMIWILGVVDLVKKDAQHEAVDALADAK